jgi:hypothetical protein
VIGARTLTVIGIVILVVSLLANFVKREALDESEFKNTSQELIADDVVRDALATVLVNQLYQNVDIPASLAELLPADQKGLAGPISGVARQGAERAAQELLERPRIQDAFVQAASAAQRQLIAVLDDDLRLLETTGGNVVLDVRPLVLALGDRFGLVSNLESRLPPDAGRVTIMKSSQLDAAQTGVRVLRFVAYWFWVLALVIWAAAIWLVPGRRRLEVRAIAIGIAISGVLVLVVVTLSGRYLVNELAATESAEPAIARVYDILTDSLRGAGWTAIIIGLVATLGVWLTAPRPSSISARRWLAPYLQRPEIAYGGLALLYLLLIWWRPTPQFGFWRNIIVFFVLAVVGLEAIRRQTAREFPNAERGEPLAALRSTAGRVSRGSGAAPTASLSSELDQLARLHDQGALDDAEYANAKAVLLGTGKG